MELPNSYYLDRTITYVTCRHTYNSPADRVVGRLFASIPRDKCKVSREGDFLPRYSILGSREVLCLPRKMGSLSQLLQSGIGTSSCMPCSDEWQIAQTNQSNILTKICMPQPACRYVKKEKNSWKSGYEILRSKSHSENESTRTRDRWGHSGNEGS